MSRRHDACRAFHGRHGAGGATVTGGAKVPYHPRRVPVPGPQRVALVGAKIDGRDVRMVIANGRFRLTFVADPDGGVMLAESARGLHPTAVERMGDLAATEVRCALDGTEPPPPPRGADSARCVSARRTLRLGLGVGA